MMERIINKIGLIFIVVQKKKSPTQQRFRSVQFFVNEVKEIRDFKNIVIWKAMVYPPYEV